MIFYPLLQGVGTPQINSILVVDVCFMEIFENICRKLTPTQSFRCHPSTFLKEGWKNKHVCKNPMQKHIYAHDISILWNKNIGRFKKKQRFPVFCCLFFVSFWRWCVYSKPIPWTKFIDHKPSCKTECTKDHLQRAAGCCSNNGWNQKRQKEGSLKSQKKNTGWGLKNTCMFVTM